MRAATVLLATGLLFAEPPAIAQAGSSRNQAPTIHEWIVLLDASFSFDDRDAEQSRALNKPGYRLRNEVLALIQRLLAAKGEKDLGLRKDYLYVYVFGETVKRISPDPVEPVTWGNALEEQEWGPRVPAGIGRRTNYFDALRVAVEDLKAKRRPSQKHILLLSDGELDVGQNNRPRRGELMREELELYDTALRHDSPDFLWLHENGVEVSTFVIDEDFAGFNEKTRLDYLLAELGNHPFEGATLLDEARSKIKSLAGLATGGRLLESEGPYVMAALGSTFCGKGYPIRYDTALRQLWKQMFPDEDDHHRVLPKGTRKVIVFAPREAAVPIRLREAAGPRDYYLTFNSVQGRYEIDSLPSVPLTVVPHETSQYIIWRVESPALEEVGKEGAHAEIEHQLNVVPLPNVGFSWVPEKPPGEGLLGEPLELGVELQWRAEPEGLSRDEWREYLKQSTIRATARIDPPDGSEPVEARLGTAIPEDDSDVVLRLSGRVPRVTAEGTYFAQAELTIGEEPRVVILRSDLKSLNLLADSPLADGERFRLFARASIDGRLGEAMAVPLPEGEEQLAAVALAVAGPPEQALISFEWWGRREDECKGVERLSIELPDLGLILGKQENELAKDQVPREGDRLVCYRSAVRAIEPESLDRDLALVVRDRLLKRERPIRFERPQPPPYWLYTLLAVLAVLAAWAALNAKKLVRRYRLIGKPFPVALEVGSKRLAWAKGEKAHRFLITADRLGKLSGELTERALERGECGVEFIQENPHECRLRSSGSEPWSYRFVDADGRTSTPHRVGSEGETVSLLELARGKKIVLEHGGEEATLRHSAR